MHSSGIKNQQRWVGNALELPWGSPVPGASLSSTVTRSGVWVPFLQSRGMGFHTDCYLECERQSWYTEAELLGHAAAGTHSLECFEFFGMWASQAETKTGICITSVTTEAKSVTVDGRQIMTYAVRAQNSKKCHTLSILKKQKIKAIHTDLSIQHISNAFLSIWEGILVVVGLIERWSPL